MFKLFVLALTLAAAPLALAKNPEPASVAVDNGGFAEQRAVIEKDLADGKTYIEIPPADRAKVRESLDRISGLLEGGKSPEALTADQKVHLYNTQEVINTLLTQAGADSRTVCSREAPTGSQRKVTTCITVAERTRRRERDQENLAKSRRGLAPVRN